MIFEFMMWLLIYRIPHPLSLIIVWTVAAGLVAVFLMSGLGAKKSVVTRNWFMISSFAGAVLALPLSAESLGSIYFALLSACISLMVVAGVFNFRAQTKGVEFPFWAQLFFWVLPILVLLAGARATLEAMSIFVS
ncbi:MAG: hypothetical protein ACKVQS_06485 [Fimbriimonadaceae bacterium]